MPELKETKANPLAAVNIYNNNFNELSTYAAMPYDYAQSTIQNQLNLK